MEKQFNKPAWQANLIMGNTILDYWFNVFSRQLPVSCSMQYMFTQRVVMSIKATLILIEIRIFDWNYDPAMQQISRLRNLEV